MRVAVKALLGLVAIGWLLVTGVSAQIVGESPDLERVLSQMDAAARNFKAVEANVTWDQYQRVINETDTEKGKIYFRRENGEIQMAVDFAEPDKKYVIYSGGKVQVYQPKIDQVNEYLPGKNRGEVESFLVLGFGGSGHDLFKSYAVKFIKAETVGGIAADELELIPKSDRLRNNIARILLWIDPARGILVQQQLFEPGGDNRLAKYSDIKVVQKLPDSVFKLKTTSKTRFVSPQG
jgi:outer membrane lipoprotein-sorting protein